MAEAFALKGKLLLAQHVRCNLLIVQSDCIEVVETMTNGDYLTNSGATMYDECNIVWSGFRRSPLNIAAGKANQTTPHERAWRGIQTKNNCIWDNEPPILEFMMNNVIFSINKTRGVFC